MRMTFGKHKGRELSDIPHDYLLWVLDNCGTASLTLRMEIGRILRFDHTAGRNGNQNLTTPIVDEWYRKLALRFHPDHGGDHRAMVAVNAGRDLLLQMVETQ